MTLPDPIPLREPFVAANPREQAELDFLGGLLLRPSDAAEAIGICQPDQFSNPRLRQVYEACLEVVATGAIPHHDSVYEILVSRGAAGALGILIDAMNAGTNEAFTKHWAGQVARFATLASLKTSFEEMARDVSTAPTGALESIIARLDSVSAGAKKAPLNGVHVPFVTRTFSEIPRQQVEWLWSPYIPLGKLTLVAGDPGVGKSWLSLAIASSLSRGWPMGGNGPVAPIGDTVLLAAEDDPEDTIGPRLDDLGADCSRIHLHEGSQIGTKKKQATLEDLDIIRGACAHHRPRLIIVDPIQNHLGAGVDAHRANEVRPLLQGLGDLAREYRCACLLICHMAKGGAQKALYRILGSIDFVAASRSMLLAGQDPDDEDTVVVAHGKSSCAKRGPSFSYTVRDGKVEWLGESDITAADLNLAGDAETASKRREVKDWLRAQLSLGPKPASDIAHYADELGYSERTVKRARQELGVKSAKDGQKWVLSL